MELIQAQLLELLATVITICIGVVTGYATKFLKEKGVIAKLESKKNYVDIVVKAVEQTYKEAKGTEKLVIAKGKIIELLNEKKIKITDEEMDTLIESVVAEMNKQIKEKLNE